MTDDQPFEPQGWRDGPPAWMDDQVAPKSAGRDFDDMAREDGLPAVAEAIQSARKARAQATDDGVNITDFYAYMPAHSYIWSPARDFWPAASVNARLPSIRAMGPDGQPAADEKGRPVMLRPSTWLDQERPVEQMTWAPGEPMIVEDRLVSEGGWIRRAGCSCFNLYRPPITEPGDARLAQPWLDHVRTVYPNDAAHIIAWLAHRVQRPQEKINHALVLGGNQGIGKDTLLEPAKYAVGPWNCSEVSPQQLLGRFNGFLKSVIMRVSEARDLGDIDRFAFYDHLKTYTAAPPDVLRVDEKHVREYSVFNVVGIVITSNHKSDGIYLPADDRRHYVAWSDLDRSDFDDRYWTDLYRWYHDEGGLRHVAQYLSDLDISAFNPKAPPPKTDAFWAIVDANRSPENSEMQDAIDLLSAPAALTKEDLAQITKDEGFRCWLLDRKNGRQVPHRLEDCGYVPVRSATATDGQWVVQGKRVRIYAQKCLSVREQHEAAAARSGRAW